MIDQAEIHRMARSEDVEERREAVEQLRDNFADLPDKKQAWKDLIRLTSDTDSYVRWSAADALESAFSHVPDKKQAWDSLYQEIIYLVRAFDLPHLKNVVVYIFPYLPDKKKGWEDLHQMTHETADFLEFVADVIVKVFPHIPDKQQAWKDLIYMADFGRAVREYTDVVDPNCFSLIFNHLPNKEQGFNDLHQMALDENSDLRDCAARAMGTAYPYILDKELAWKDLHCLTFDTNSGVRRGAADVLGSVFTHVPDKKQAWKDLHRLTFDTDTGVRASAYHSMGKASIFKATIAENDIDFKKEMEAAIGYFEKSSQQGMWPSLAEFCLPFYRSFYTLTFKKEETEVEVQKYITEAKSAVEGSESKEKLLEAVENLGNALKEAQKVRDFNDIKADLNAYRRYCERACELLESTEEKAPGASRLIKRGLPIIDERIKGILSEIQEKAKTVCKQTKGTEFESLGKDVYNAGHRLSNVRDPIGLEKNADIMFKTLSDMCKKLPEDERSFACELLEKAQEEQYVDDRLNLYNNILNVFKSINYTNIKIVKSKNVRVIVGNNNVQN